MSEVNWDNFISHVQVKNQGAPAPQPWDGNWAGINWGSYMNQSLSGEIVSPETARCVAAAHACTKLIADSVAIARRNIYRKSNDGTRQLVYDHPYDWLLNTQPYEDITAASFWRWMMDDCKNKGDGFAQIVTNINGVVIGLKPLTWSCVTPFIWQPFKQLMYRVQDDEKSYVLFPSEILHFPGFGFNGLHGQSVVTYAAREALGLNQGQTRFAGTYFVNGSSVAVALEFPENKELTEKQVIEIRKQINERSTQQGRHMPIILQGGGKVATPKITANDTQLIEALKFSAQQICTAYGVPPEMVGLGNGIAGYNGLTELTNWFTKFTIGADQAVLDQELTRKLYPGKSPYYVEVDNLSGLSLNPKAEAEYMSIALGGNGRQGWLTVNEVRQRKQMQPVEGGDELRYTVKDNSPQEAPKDEQPNQPVTE